MSTNFIFLTSSLQIECHFHMTIYVHRSITFSFFWTLPPTIYSKRHLRTDPNLFFLLEGPILPSLHFQRPNFPSGNDWSIGKRTDNLQFRGFQIDDFVFKSSLSFVNLICKPVHNTFRTSGHVKSSNLRLLWKKLGSIIVHLTTPNPHFYRHK